MATNDFYKEHKELYSPSDKAPVILEIPAFNFLMIDGKGDPNKTTEYQNAVEALFSVSYTLKFMPKKGFDIPGFEEYKVGPLEGLWWMEDNSEFVLPDKKDDWQWTMMIRQPDFITREVFKQALEMAAKKKPNPALEKMRFEKYTEGLSVQLMHIGAYSEEHPNIVRMHEFALSQGYKLQGKHHEIYFGDPRKSAPEKLRTVLRQPLTK